MKIKQLKLQARVPGVNDLNSQNIDVTSYATDTD